MTKTVTGAGAESWTYSYVPNGASGNTPLLEGQSDATRTMPVVHDPDGNVTELRRETFGESDLVVSMAYTQDMNLETHTEEDVESTYRYDADGYLTHIMRDDGSEYSNAQLVYDYRGRLLAVTHGEEFSELDRVYVYAERQPIAMLLGSPTEKATVYNIITDHLGTPVLYFRNEQQYTRVWYTPFGEVTDVEEVGGPAPPLDLRFPGQVDFSSAVSDWPTYYNIHRWYMPDWGRYSQADPEWLESLLLESRFHMAYTPFVYSRNRPSVEIDPLGLMSFKYHKTCDRLSSTQRTALEAAASDAGRNAEKAPSCVSRSLESVKIRCGSCGNNCGRVFMGKFCINVELNEGGKCGVGPDCLASTILHELVHKCGGNEREAYGCEKRFYGGSCSFEVPDKYKPKCPKPCG